ncbi:MAG: extracellular solute-binding protein [Oscillospiraceae bacterium]|nr:extracellular solute-binding protein [Oscillospiraceae bacterium]
MPKKHSKKKLKIIAVLTVSFILLALFGACSTNTNNTNNNTNNTTDANAADNTGETTTAKLVPNLPDADFGGYEFKILTRASADPDWVDWVPRDVYAENETGDTINDAVFSRNAYVEDKYNFKITQVFTNTSGDFSSPIRKAVAAGDEMYDMIEAPMRDSPGFAQSGYFLDLYNVPNLDLTQPWWDQGANKALSVGGKLYFTSGDIMMINNDTCAGIVFNKGLLQSLGLSDPYQIVKDGKWTSAQLYDMCKGAASDLNGDGQMTYQDDRFGFICQRDTVISFLHSAGEYICQKDDNDQPYITFGGDRSYAALTGCFNVMYDENISLNLHHYEGKIPTGIYPMSQDVFMGDRALFMWLRLRIVENLRSMNTDFGILPLPKADENQSDYYTDVISYTGNFMCIPVTASDPGRTGQICEALCAESMYTTMPAYYDITLKTKMARDEESSEMLDIIFKNRIWDIGEISNYGDFGWQLISLSMKDNPDVTSLFDKLQGKMQSDIDKAVTKYSALS